VIGVVALTTDVRAELCSSIAVQSGSTLNVYWRNRRISGWEVGGLIAAQIGILRRDIGSLGSVRKCLYRLAVC